MFTAKKRLVQGDLSSSVAEGKGLDSGRGQEDKNSVQTTVVQNSEPPQKFAAQNSEPPQKFAAPPHDEVPQKIEVVQKFPYQISEVVQKSEVVQGSDVVQKKEVVQKSEAPQNIEAHPTMFLLRQVGSLNAFGLALLLRDIAGYPEGIISLRNIARASGKVENTIRNNFAALENAGVLKVLNTDNSGTHYRFLLDLPKVVQKNEVMQKFEPPQKFGSPQALESPQKNEAPPLLLFLKDLKTTTRGNFFLVQELESMLQNCFATLRCLKKNPKEISPQVVLLFLEIAMVQGEEFAAAFFLEFLPKAKDPLSYLQAVKERRGFPQEKSLKLAKKVLLAAEDVKKQIGVQILPQDWEMAARELGVSARVNPEIAKEEFEKEEQLFVKKMLAYPSLS